MKRLLLSLIVALMSFGAMAQSYVEKSISVSGTSRKIRIHVPTNLPENAPLVISFHGMNQDPEYQMNQTGWNTLADKEKFAVVYPYGINKMWDTGGDSEVNFTKQIISYMERTYKINKNRVYASGFSLGATLTYHLINKMGKQIAAFAPVSGVSFGANFKPSGPRHVPLIHHHSSGDNVFWFAGDMTRGEAMSYPSITDRVTQWAKWNGCDMDNKVTKRVGADQHIVWTNANEGIETAYNIIDGGGHWHSNGTNTNTTQEIWNFVKRYSLDGDMGCCVLRAVPSDGKSITSTSTFTFQFVEKVDTKSAKATLTCGEQVIELITSTTAATSQSLKFVLPDDTQLKDGSYEFKIDNLSTATGGVKGKVTYLYTSEGNNTAVTSVRSDVQHGLAFNLSGQMTTADAKGVVINGGKKYYNK